MAINTDSSTCSSNVVLHLRNMLKFDSRLRSMTSQPHFLLRSKCSAIDERFAALTNVEDFVCSASGVFR